MNSAELPPYAALIGIRVAETTTEAGIGPTLTMDFSSQVEGRPGILHGGSTAGLIEMAANAAIAATAASADTPFHAKPIGITIDYMRPGLPRPSFARGRVTRVGSRVATVVVDAWQDEARTPIALARIHMLIVRDEA